MLYHIIYLIYIYNCLCGSVAKASDTQAVGQGSTLVQTINYFIKWVLKYYLEVILYNCV